MQVLSNMIDYGMEPQAALNAPRFSVEGVDSAYGPGCVEYSRYSACIDMHEEPLLLACGSGCHLLVWQYRAGYPCLPADQTCAIKVVASSCVFGWWPWLYDVQQAGVFVFTTICQSGQPRRKSC